MVSSTSLIPVPDGSEELTRILFLRVTRQAGGLCCCSVNCPFCWLHFCRSMFVSRLGQKMTLLMVMMEFHAYGIES